MVLLPLCCGLPLNCSQSYADAGKVAHNGSHITRILKYHAVGGPFTSDSNGEEGGTLVSSQDYSFGCETSPEAAFVMTSEPR